MADKTQVTTGPVRFSYCNLFHPRPVVEGAPPKYSVTLLIPKSDKKTLDAIDAAIVAAKAQFAEKNKGKGLPAKCKTTLWDGDGENNSGEPFGEECHGCMVISVNSNRKPLVINRMKQVITDEDEVYSGCYGQAIINFYGYDVPGNKGVTAGLNGIMKVKEGERLSGSRISVSDFDDSEFGDDLDDLMG